MDQRTRMMMLDNFRKGNIKLLVASDVAARGLDIPEVSHVFNYDVPINAEDYVHRIGRTGRAGRSGAAYTLVTGEDKKYLDAIETLINKTIDWLGEPIDFEAAAKERKARRKGRQVCQERIQQRQRCSRRRKPSSRRRSQSKQRDTHTDSKSGAKDDAVSPMPTPVSELPQKPASKKSRNEKMKPAFSPGVHIPAFLLREPRPKKAS